jgi:hypothetical protein
VTELDELRHEIAHAHGLPENATRFLTGTNLEQIEGQAATLATLAAEPEPDPLTAALTEGTAEKARRRRALARSLHPTQRRDERGRYTSPASFDGGARTPVSEPSNPHEQHNQLVIDAVRHAREHRGGQGFQV